ncbi:MAG: alpha-glucan family phosphorylase [Desulfobulbaceae bacterium]|nr:alpha-glucan family phosphorylase [Desulfobulbaceae bacterium]
MHPRRYLPRPLPDALNGLAVLALDMRWSWNHAADNLWKAIDPELWYATGNPWYILESVSQSRLDILAQDRDFLRELELQLEKRETALRQPAWFQQNYGPDAVGGIAYFSMEFGLSEALPIYSGGLGILAGDYLKTASDLGIPIIGIGLLYQQGYFHQALNVHGDQLEFFPFNDPTMLPVIPLRDRDGGLLTVAVPMPGRELILRAWEVQVGRVRLYLLDSNEPLNVPEDRGITGKLYEGAHEIRLQQEIALGIGGWRLLEKLGMECEICHLNEGHAAFVVLERAFSFMKKSGQSFQAALHCTRPGNIFTTHTPVQAGFDSYPLFILKQYITAYTHQIGVDPEILIKLGRAEQDNHREYFNTAYLAFRGSGTINGVSRLHGDTSRRIFQPLFPHWPASEVPIGSVTNGVHVPSWDSAHADNLWTDSCGKDRWLTTLETVKEKIKLVSEKSFWEFRCKSRRDLIDFIRRRVSQQEAALGADKDTVACCNRLFDSDTLTIGFARRFTDYKRPNLLMHDQHRLLRILTDQQQPVQLIIAGKAHPQDRVGKLMVRRWIEFLNRPEVREHAVFIQNYDLTVAAKLVQGVDLWINTPRRPWEACGTSGMKVLVNGGLNLSEMDGWWAEAFDAEVGWAVGNGREHGADPVWDAKDAAELYRVLEEEVVPVFYSRNQEGIPVEWVSRIRASMTRLTPLFSSNRMVREYIKQHYLPATMRYRHRVSENGAAGVRIESWRRELEQHWHKLRFGNLDRENTDDGCTFHVQVYLDDLDPENLQVELYAEPLDTDEPERHPMQRGKKLSGTDNGYLYYVTVKTERPTDDYTPRIIPNHSEALIPLEDNHILWQR